LFESQSRPMKGFKIKDWYLKRLFATAVLAFRVSESFFIIIFELYTG
jgi:hypothetical protein